MKHSIQILKLDVKIKNLPKYLLVVFLTISVSSCFAPLSSSKIPKSARKKLNTHNHRKGTAAKWGVIDKAADCPSPTRRREKYK